MLSNLAPIQRLLPSALRRRRLVIFEARNKLLLGHRVLMTRRFENAEVARLAGELERLPQAKVATVVATYRRPELLCRAVQSALAQTVRDHVVIVIDDAGGLPELPDDPRLFAVSLTANTAIAGVVRNVGIRLSRSKYIAFLDDDNEWEPNHLDVAISALEDGSNEHRPDLVYTAVQRFLPDGRLVDVISKPFDRRLLAWISYVDTSALVIRRSPDLHFSRLNRKRSTYPIEDWELVFRLSRNAAVAHLPIPTVRYLVNPDTFFSVWPEDIWAQSSDRRIQ